jgi:hypothetical protein
MGYNTAYLPNMKITDERYRICIHLDTMKSHHEVLMKCAIQLLTFSNIEQFTCPISRFSWSESAIQIVGIRNS